MYGGREVQIKMKISGNKITKVKPNFQNLKHFYLYRHTFTNTETLLQTLTERVGLTHRKWTLVKLFRGG